MRKYSRSREDFREELVKKYAVYTVNENQMKEAIFIEGIDCVKCHTMKPHVQKWCEKNGYNFQVVKFDDVSVKEFDIQAVPMLVFRWDGLVSEVLDEEKIVNLISNK